MGTRRSLDKEARNRFSTYGLGSLEHWDHVFESRWATGWMIGVRIPVGAGNFSPLYRVHTGSGVYPASYPIGTGGSFPGVKAAGA
jgi:hypothetical protein